MTYSIGETLIPPAALQRIADFLDPRSLESVMQVDRSYARLREEYTSEKGIDWSHWAVHRIFFVREREKVTSSFSVDARSMEHVFSYLHPEELAILESVSHAWKSSIATCWKTQALIQGFQMEHVSSYKRAFSELYLSSLGPKVWEKYLGKVDSVPPIPQRFLEMASELDHIQAVHQSEKALECVKRNYRLMLIPEQLLVQALPESPWTLEPDGRLMEVSTPCRAIEEWVKVPVTLNNLAVLVNNLIKSEEPIFFHEASWRPIFLEHGNTHVKKTRWVYQRVESVLGQFNSTMQMMWVGASNRDIVPFVDRVLFNILIFLQSGKKVDLAHRVRTATLTLDIGAAAEVFSTILWSPRKLLVSKDEEEGNGVSPIDVAVEVPVDLPKTKEGISFEKGIRYYYAHARTIR